MRDSNLQTRISHRETFAGLLRSALRRYRRVEDAIGKPLAFAQRATHDPTGEPTEIGTEDAHHLEQMLSGVLDWYLEALADTEHQAIEEKKARLATALSSLRETLGDAHWADHNDQQQDEHFIADDEWAAIVARCAEAKTEAAEKVSALGAAYGALRDAQDEWVGSLRSQIAALDQSIAAQQNR